MKTMGELLDAIREQYLEQFREAMREVEKSGMQAMAEAAYRNEDGTLTREGVLNQPMRLDIVAFVDDEAKSKVRVDSKTMLSFDPAEFEWSDIPVRVAPFFWDGCNIRVFGVSERMDWSPVAEWLERWFDVEDTCQPDEHGLCGVVHFISDPERNGSATIFEVDFGSAPAEAFEELLDALRDSGAKRIEIGG